MIEYICDIVTVYIIPIVIACLYSYALEDKEKEKKSNESVQTPHKED